MMMHKYSFGRKNLHVKLGHKYLNKNKHLECATFQKMMANIHLAEISARETSEQMFE